MIHLPPQILISTSAGFSDSESNTWILETDNILTVTAGKFEVIPLDSYNKLIEALEELATDNKSASLALRYLETGL